MATKSWEQSLVRIVQMDNILAITLRKDFVASKVFSGYDWRK